MNEPQEDCSPDGELTCVQEEALLRYASVCGDLGHAEGRREGRIEGRRAGYRTGLSEGIAIATVVGSFLYVILPFMGNL